jgi:hypothetical protein
MEEIIFSSLDMIKLAMVKAAFFKMKTLFTSKLVLHFRKETGNC